MKKKGSGLYKHAVKRASRNRLRKSVANSLRAHYFPQKQENIRLARARRKQIRPASLKFRGPTTKPSKPPVMMDCMYGSIMVSSTLFEKNIKS